MFTQACSETSVRLLLEHLLAPRLPVLVCGLLAFLALGPRNMARAQSTSDPELPEPVLEAPDSALASAGVSRRASLAERVTRALRVRGPLARQEALSDLIAVATTAERGADFSAMVPLLIQVVEHDPSEDRRLMALQALRAIGTEHASQLYYRIAMNQLRHVAEDDPSRRVRQVATALVNGFYAEEDK